MASFIDKLDINELQNIILNSTSISEILRKLGKTDGGSNHTKLVNFLKEHPEINTETLVGRRIQRVNKKGIPLKKLSQVLVKNGTGNSHKLKLRLIKEGLKEEKCEVCGNIEWMGQPIPLDLHHINGDHFDNRLDNLIIVCPNCHRLTDNWGSKNSSIDLIFKQIAEQTAEDKIKLLLEQEKKRENEIYQNKLKYGNIRKYPNKEKIIKYCQLCGKEITGKGEKYCSDECYKKEVTKNIPSKEQLLKDSLKFKSLEQLSRIYNVTANGCKKWLKKYDIYDEVKKNFKQDYSIVQYSLEGDFIKEWKNAIEIETELNIKRNHIQRNCNGLQHSSYGFIWKYKKDLK